MATTAPPALTRARARHRLPRRRLPAAALALALALAPTARPSLAQSARPAQPAPGDPADDPGVTVHGRARTDGCLAFAGPLGPHGLPAADTEELSVQRARYLLLSDADARRVSRSGPRPALQGSPAARVTQAARTRMVGVVRAFSEHLVQHFSNLRFTGRVGSMGQRAVYGGQVFLPGTTPVYGGMSDALSLETRQCAVDYEVHGTLGPVRCRGHRVAIHAGPERGVFASFVRALVRDYCFVPGRDDEAIVRVYAVRGPVRALPPFFSRASIDDYVDMRLTAARYWFGEAFESEAGLYLTSVEPPPPPATAVPAAPEASSATPPTSARPALPAPVTEPPAECAPAIARVTQRYYELQRLIATTLEPINAEVDAALERWAREVDPERIRAADAGPGATGYAARAWVYQEMQRIARPLNARSPCATDLAYEPWHTRNPRCRSLGETWFYSPLERRPFGAVDEDEDHSFARWGSPMLCRFFAVAGRGGVAAETSYHLGGHVNRRRGESCSLLHLDPFVTTTHHAQVFDPVEPSHPEAGGVWVVRDERRVTSLEDYARAMLAATGHEQCAPAVRPLRWPDARAVVRPARSR